MDSTQGAVGIGQWQVRRDWKAKPAAYTGVDGNVLLAIRRTHVAHGRGNDARAHFVFPQHFTTMGVNRFKPAIHGAVKDHIAAGGEHAAPHWKWFFNAPNLFAFDRIPGDEFAVMSPW